MEFYWNKKNQPIYCVGLYCDDLFMGYMELSTNEEKKLDDELVETFINKYEVIVGKYETPDYIFYADLDHRSNRVFFEYNKKIKNRGEKKMNVVTTVALEYLLQGYKDDLHHYETKIEQYKRYAENAKKNIAEIEKELEQREEI